jgi:hypothetical protein
MKNLIFFSFCLLSTLRVNAQILFVNQQVSGGLYDGTSWANAYVNLQQALATAQPNDQIWVAKGTYKPGDDNDRERSFVLHTGVSMYGGFAGTETQLSQRNPLTNPTVLALPLRRSFEIAGLNKTKLPEAAQLPAFRLRNLPVFRKFNIVNLSETGRKPLAVLYIKKALTCRKNHSKL